MCALQYLWDRGKLDGSDEFPELSSSLSAVLPAVCLIETSDYPQQSWLLECFPLSHSSSLCSPASPVRSSNGLLYVQVFNHFLSSSQNMSNLYNYHLTAKLPKL